MITAEQWIGIAEQWYDEFIRLKIEVGCGDIRREIFECFSDWLESEKGFVFDWKDSTAVTEIALFWFDEKLEGDGNYCSD